MAQDLELFYKDDCPYCHKVMDFMDAHGIAVTMRDVVEEPANRERLLSVGGKAQVPCLFIDGTPLYESGDIIDFLAQRFAVDAPALSVESSGGSCSLDGTCH